MNDEPLAIEVAQFVREVHDIADLLSGHMATTGMPKLRRAWGTKSPSWSGRGSKSCLAGGD